MAKRFDAPIPLTDPWITQARRRPSSDDASEILQEAAALMGLSDLPSSAYEGPLKEWVRLGEQPARIAYTNLFTALAVAGHVRDVAANLMLFSRDTDDALAVDDFALIVFCATAARHDLSALTISSHRVRDEGQGKPELIAAIEAWMEQESPIRARHEHLKSLFDTGAVGAPCLHVRAHHRLGKRGPKATVPARIKVWATYAISWMTGNETLAVRIWNRLMLPPEFRWTPEAYNSKAGLDYAVKKYSDAKRRLKKDIIGSDPYVNQMIFQGLSPVAPPAPLDHDTSELVLWIFETILARNVDALVGGISKASPLEALVLPS